MPRQKHTLRRGQPLFLLVGTVVALLVASAPVAVPAFAAWHHETLVNSLAYKQTHGHWDTINLPAAFRLNTVHAAVLPTGKVLLVAGSGNNRDNFDQFNNEGMISVLKTAVFDPETNKIKIVPTPSDLFCSGHAMLQSGNLLVAGGTSGYEVLDGEVKKPAGSITIHNEDPDAKVRSFKKGTRFISNRTHKIYLSTQDVTVEPAMKMNNDDGTVMVMHSSAKVFVEAVAEDSSYVAKAGDKYAIDGVTGGDVRNLYGQGDAMTLKKQDYRGDDKSYEFDPIKEKYVRVGDLHESRWYPSLPVLANGDVLAVSGLDNAGQITQTTERYDPNTKQWSWGPDQAFATYPALFRTKDPDVLFYSGSNAGYGPEDKGRTPGFWNVRTNGFQPVAGLREPGVTETSASVILPPAKGSNDGSQSSRVMLAGGGGIGESDVATARTDIIDLAAADPHYVPGPDLPSKLRYVNMTVTPWDEVFMSGGTHDYRAKGNSYNYQSAMLNPTTSRLEPMADELVGRGYHSGSLLLRDGRILVFGNDPLYDDKDDTTTGTFEQRLEIYTAPELYATAKRPELKGADMQQVHRGQQLSFDTADAANIKTARLIPPSSTTHVTNLEQRAVGAVVTTHANKVTISLPDDGAMLTNGWYMLFVTNANGTPSHAKMIQVVDGQVSTAAQP